MSLNTVSTELQGGGYGDRLLAAVFAFEEEGRPLYFIYNFKRGTYYPFVPKGNAGARLRARAAPQGPAGRRAAVRGGHGPLVPALGDPALGADSAPRLPRSVEARIPLARPLTAGWAVTPTRDAPDHQEEDESDLLRTDRHTSHLSRALRGQRVLALPRVRHRIGCGRRELRSSAQRDASAATAGSSPSGVRTARQHPPIGGSRRSTLSCPPAAGWSGRPADSSIDGEGSRLQTEGLPDADHSLHRRSR